MYDLKVRLNSVDKVNQFVRILGKYEGQFDLFAGKYTVDAKSILGILTFDLSRPLTLRSYSDNIMPECLNRELHDYLIENMTV